MVVIDLLDEREQARARLASADCRAGPFLYGTALWYQTSTGDRYVFRARRAEGERGSSTRNVTPVTGGEHTERRAVLRRRTCGSAPTVGRAREGALAAVADQIRRGERFLAAVPI